MKMQATRGGFHALIKGRAVSQFLLRNNPKLNTQRKLLISFRCPEENVLSGLTSETIHHTVLNILISLLYVLSVLITKSLPNFDPLDKGLSCRKERDFPSYTF